MTGRYVEPLFLPEVERVARSSDARQQFAALESEGIPVPQILYLLAFKPHCTDYLSRFTQEVMRGPSPLTPAQRELIAAFTSSRNRCVF